LPRPKPTASIVELLVIADRCLALPRSYSITGARIFRKAGNGGQPWRLPSWRQILREQRGTVTLAARTVHPHPAATPPTSRSARHHMNRRKPSYFRSSIDLRDKVQVKVLRRRLKLSDDQFANVVRKSGGSISAMTKEAAALK
jgi:hypothetical protein